MARISINDSYFNRLTQQQLKDFMTFVLFANVAGVQYDSPLFKSLLFKLELPPVEVTVVEDPPKGGGQAPAPVQSEIKPEPPKGETDGQQEQQK